MQKCQYFSKSSSKRTRHPLFECGQVAVRSECGHIVDEWQVLLNVALRPIAEVQIQQALIAAIETAMLYGELCDFGERLQAGTIYEHTGVEAVGPADIGCGR